MPTSPDPFLTVQDLSDHLGRDVTADNGAVMAVDAACDIVRELTEQDFNFATSTVGLDGTGTDALVLPQGPVAQAGTVTVNGGTVTDYMLVPDSSTLIRGTAGARYYWSPVWPMGRQNVRVTYDHGYLVAGTANDVPRSIRMVALMIAERLVVQGVAQSETLGDVSMTYATKAGELTKSEEAILYGYLRRRSF